jgi:DNA-binding HxlR family transcriptional regulator
VVTRTAAQRRRESREAYLEAMTGCPTHRWLGRMGDRWWCLVVKELATGSRRHAELARAVPGASQKMLTQTLRQLERDGLVSRSVSASVPPRVDYTLTELGCSLLPVLAVVTEWAQAHMADVDAARASYDRSVSATD